MDSFSSCGHFAVVLGTGMNLGPRPRRDVRALDIALVLVVKLWKARLDGWAKKYHGGRSAIWRQAL